MWTLTGFADEIGPDLELQIDTLTQEGLKFLELRGVWGKNVLKLSDEEIAKVKVMLAEAGIGVSSIGSPIGKIKITDDFAPHIEEFKRAIWCAQELKAPFIRLFSFYIPDGQYAEYRSEVMRRMQIFVDEAANSGVILLHENEKGIYGDVPDRCLDICQTINSPLLRQAWDPSNFVQCGVAPFTEGYEKLRPYISYVHVKDCDKEQDKVVPAGEGNGEVRETLAALRDSGFDGFFSLEPHLKAGGQFSGFSGPDLFRRATQAFKGLLTEAGIAWQ